MKVQVHWMVQAQRWSSHERGRGGGRGPRRVPVRLLTSGGRGRCGRGRCGRGHGHEDLPPLLKRKIQF